MTPEPSLKVGECIIQRVQHRLLGQVWEVQFEKPQPPSKMPATGWFDSLEDAKKAAERWAEVSAEADRLLGGE